MSLKIGEVFKKALKDRGLTLREVSQGSGVSISTLSEWSGNRKPKDPTQAQRVAKFLGLSLHYFLFGEPDSQEKINLSQIFKENVFEGTFEVSVKRIHLNKEEIK